MKKKVFAATRILLHVSGYLLMIVCFYNLILSAVAEDFDRAAYYGIMVVVVDSGLSRNRRRERWVP